MEQWSTPEQRKGNKNIVRLEVLPRLELGSLDTESKVLTITPQNHLIFNVPLMNFSTQLNVRGLFEDIWKLIVEEMSFRIPYGSVPEWSKALVLGTSHFGDVGSSPTAASCYFLNSRFEIEDLNLVFHQMFPNND